MQDETTHPDPGDEPMDSFDWNEFDDGFSDLQEPSFFTLEPQEEERKIKKEQSSHRRKTVCTCFSDRYLYRRGFSEARLLEAMSLEKFEEGQSWHFITSGDVDSLSFLKVVLLHQPQLSHLLFSTWCMSAEDVLQFQEWVEGGVIKSLDCYVGEIFPSSYKVEYKMLKDLVERTGCGRLAVFRNHSKVFAGVGDRFAFAIESSANINTNPRTEQGVITINGGLYDFYKEYFDGIRSFL